MSTMDRSGDGITETRWLLQGPAIREGAGHLGLCIAGYGLIRGPVEVILKEGNPSRITLLPELTHIMRQKLLTDRRCTIGARIIMTILGAGLSAYNTYTSGKLEKIDPSNSHFHPGLLPANFSLNLALFGINGFIQAAFAGWMFSEVVELFSWKLKIRTRGRLRGFNCGERLGIAAVFLLSLAMGAISLSKLFANRVSAITAAEAFDHISSSAAQTFSSIFALTWLLAHLFQSRGACGHDENQSLKELIVKMQVLAQDNSNLQYINPSNWVNERDFLRSMIQFDKVQLSSASARFPLVRGLIGGLMATTIFLLSMADSLYSNDFVGNSASPVMMVLDTWQCLQGIVFNYIYASAFVQAMADTFCLRSERSLIEQFFPKLLAGMSVPFFLVSVAAGIFMILSNYPVVPNNRWHNEWDNFTTTHVPISQAPDSLKSAAAIVSGVQTFLLGMFVLRECLKIVLRCSVATKGDSENRNKLDLSLNLLSASAHIQSMPSDEVQQAITHCS